jgi:hypothetical protein
MTDISFAMEAKSDQLNAPDIMGNDRIIKITRVNVVKGDQPISVYFDGDHNRPWKPSKGMVRILAAAWSTESANWVGKSVQLYFDDTVKWAGKEVGGIRIRAMSDIPQNGLKVMVTLNRQQRNAHVIDFLNTERPMYPEDKFSEALPAMVKAMFDGKMTLQQVISRLQQTGDLTDDQFNKLQAAAPVEVDEQNEEEAE